MNEASGVISGGWEFVIAAYTLTALLFGVAMLVVGLAVGIPLLENEPGPDLATADYATPVPDQTLDSNVVRKPDRTLDSDAVSRPDQTGAAAGGFSCDRRATSICRNTCAGGLWRRRSRRAAYK